MSPGQFMTKKHDAEDAMRNDAMRNSNKWLQAIEEKKKSDSLERENLLFVAFDKRNENAKRKYALRHSTDY